VNKILNMVPYVGALIVAVGMIAGFTYMYLGNDHLTKIFLGMVPVGFLVLFVGVVTNMLKD
jgi:predicted lysophospholipase L1 biosynthesis ABC-type transport system permease subunit